MAEAGPGRDKAQIDVVSTQSRCVGIQNLSISLRRVNLGTALHANRLKWAIVLYAKCESKM